MFIFKLNDSFSVWRTAEATQSATWLVSVLTVLCTLLVIPPAHAQPNPTDLNHVANVHVNLSCTGAYTIPGSETRTCTSTVKYDPRPAGVPDTDPDFPPSFTGTLLFHVGNVEVAKFNRVVVPLGGTASRTITLNCQPGGDRKRTLRNVANGLQTNGGFRVCSSVNNPPCPPGCGRPLAPPCPSGCGGTRNVCVDSPVSVTSRYGNTSGVINERSNGKNFLCLPGSGPTTGN